METLAKKSMVLEGLTQKQYDGASEYLWEISEVIIGDEAGHLVYHLGLGRGTVNADVKNRRLKPSDEVDTSVVDNVRRTIKFYESIK